MLQGGGEREPESGRWVSTESRKENDGEDITGNT